MAGVGGGSPGLKGGTPPGTHAGEGQLVPGTLGTAHGRILYIFCHSKAASKNQRFLKHRKTAQTALSIDPVPSKELF